MKSIFCAFLLLGNFIAVAQQTVISQSKGSSFTTTDDLRNYSGKTDKSYIFRVTNQRGVQDYVWDSTDVNTPDDNVLTVVGAGKRRFKLKFTGPIDASWYNANPNAQDNARALQSALNAAGTSITKKVLVSNAKYFLTSNVTVPSGVTLEIGPGGLLTGTATVTGGIIAGDLRQQLFTTGVTVHPEACAAGVFSMRWYGADGEGDDYKELQKCFDVCTFQNKIKHIWWPNGTYQVSKGLLFDRDDNGDGQREFPTGYIIEGEDKAYGGSGEVTLVCTNGNSFGINFQHVKGLIVRNIMAIGQNEELRNLSAVDVMENPNTNWDNGNRVNPQSPHVAFAIDAIGTSAMATSSRYPDFVSKYTDASRGGSTDITFEHCGARYWIVGFGISLAGTVQNGDKVSFNYCWSDNNKYAFANGNSQNRSNKLYQCGIWGQTYVAFDCQTFGENIGNPQEIEETNIAGYVRYLCKLNNWFSNGMTINNSHFELLGSLGGNFSQDNGVLTINNTFANLAGDMLAGNGASIHHHVTIFRGESLTFTNSTLTYYSAGSGPMSLCAKYALFDNTRFDVLPINTQSIAQTTFRHCKVGLFPFGDGDKITWTDPRVIANQSPYFTTDMEYVTPFGARDNYGSFVRKKINRTYNNKGYGMKDAQLIYLGKISVGNVQDPDNSQSKLAGIAHAELKLAAESDEFKMLQPNDNIITQGTDEFGRTNVMHQFGTVVTKEASGIVTVKEIPRGTSAKSYDLWLYRPHVLIPVFAIGNISKGTNTIADVLIEGNVQQLPTGITLNSPFFPEGTVILSYDPKSSTITTSNAATTTRKGIDIVSSDWQTIQYGYANPTVVDYLGYKSGDIIYNTRKDLFPDVLFWVCNSSGITNTKVPPVFTAITGSGTANGTQTISSGVSATIGDNTKTVFIDPGAALSKLVVTLPGNPVDGQEVRIVCGGTLYSGAVVSSLTINTNSSQAIIQSVAPAKASAGESFIYQYRSGIKKWYRIQ